MRKWTTASLFLLEFSNRLLITTPTYISYNEPHCLWMFINRHLFPKQPRWKLWQGCGPRFWLLFPACRTVDDDDVSLRFGLRRLSRLSSTKSMHPPTILGFLWRINPATWSYFSGNLLIMLRTNNFINRRNWHLKLKKCVLLKWILKIFLWT